MLKFSTGKYYNKIHHDHEIHLQSGIKTHKEALKSKVQLKLVHQNH